jgi:hypothetical protein
MGEIAFVLIPLLAAIATGMLNHAMAKRGKWTVACGILLGCIIAGAIAYEWSNAASGYDGIVPALFALLVALPAAVGAVIGIATGARKRTQ